MCIDAISLEKTHENCEEALGLKKGSLLLGVALGKPTPNYTLPEKEIKTKVS